jgi:chromosome segregation protein
MRASNLKEVIFKGAEGRRAARSAEVTLTLTRDDLLSLTSSEVEVRRKIKSNGDSEFYLNGRRVRLKDIQEFFASIGLGTKEYAFFEQGQIDRVLKMRPAERRALIDEAAETTLFKEKKEETLKELEEAEQNLESVRGVLEEVGRNLRSLKSQAEKAKRFQELRKQEKELELKLLGIQLKNVRLTKEFAESNLKALQEDRNSLEDEVASLKRELESLRERIRELTGEMRRPPANSTRSRRARKRLR